MHDHVRARQGRQLQAAYREQETRDAENLLALETEDQRTLALPCWRFLWAVTSVYSAAWALAYAIGAVMCVATLLFCVTQMR